MIDKASLTALKDIMGTDFENLVNIFIKDSETRIELLGNLIKMDNADEISKMAHSIKGSSGSLHANKMSALCFELEKQAHANNPSNTESLHQQLAEEFIRVKKELLKYWV